MFLHRNVAPHRMRFGENIKLMDFLSSLLAFAQRRAKRLGPGQLAADESCSCHRTSAINMYHALLPAQKVRHKRPH